MNAHNSVIFNEVSTADHDAEFEFLVFLGID